MINKTFGDDPRVKADAWDGLVVEYAKKHGIQALVRGLRPTGDFEMEFQMASMNSHLNSDIDTFWLPTGGKHYFVSSTLVKELYKHGGDISEFIPETVLEFLKKKG